MQATLKLFFSDVVVIAIKSFFVRAQNAQKKSIKIEHPVDGKHHFFNGTSMGRASEFRFSVVRLSVSEWVGCWFFFH